VDRFVLTSSGLRMSFLRPIDYLCSLLVTVLLAGEVCTVSYCMMCWMCIYCWVASSIDRVLRLDASRGPVINGVLCIPVCRNRSKCYACIP